MKSFQEWLTERYRHSGVGPEPPNQTTLILELSDYLAEAGVGPSPPDPEPEVRYMEIPAELIDRRWFPMSSAPKDGTVIDAVGRYTYATAGFPQYVQWIDGAWRRPSNRGFGEPLVCWAWRPRTAWPSENWAEKETETVWGPVSNQLWPSAPPPKTPEPEVTEEWVWITDEMVRAAKDRWADLIYRNVNSNAVIIRELYKTMRALEPKRPVEITREMEKRALYAWQKAGGGPCLPAWEHNRLRAALQAALEGEG